MIKKLTRLSLIFGIVAVSLLGVVGVIAFDGVETPYQKCHSDCMDDYNSCMGMYNIYNCNSHIYEYTSCIEEYPTNTYLCDQYYDDYITCNDIGTSCTNSYNTCMDRCELYPTQRIFEYIKNHNKK